MYVEGIRKHIFLVEEYCQKGSKILDLGCGGGHLSLQLISLGFNVRGIDVKEDNQEMIEIFSQKEGLQSKIWKDLGNRFHIPFDFYNGWEIPFSDESRVKSLDQRALNNWVIFLASHFGLDFLK